MRDRSEHIRPWSDHDPTQKTQTATRRATEATFRTRQEQIVLKITTFPTPAIIPNFTTCCACHEKSHSNFTKYCTCHAKWISWLIRVTYERHLQCAEQQESPCACHAKWISSLIRLNTAPATQNALYASVLFFSVLASISWYLFSLGFFSLLASILSWHFFSLGICSLLVSILSWHLLSLGILSWHLFSLSIYSLLASILSHF